MKKLICAIAVCILISGCASVKVTQDLNGTVTWESTTLLKDISVDPNGVASTTSSYSDSIIGSVAGFILAMLTM